MTTFINLVGTHILEVRFKWATPSMFHRACRRFIFFVIIYLDSEFFEEFSVICSCTFFCIILYLEEFSVICFCKIVCIILYLTLPISSTCFHHNACLRFASHRLHSRDPLLYFHISRLESLFMQFIFKFCIKILKSEPIEPFHTQEIIEAKV